MENTFSCKDCEQDIENEINCAICLNQLERNQNYIKHPYCSHKFHHDCIITWIKSINSCPLCRNGFPSQRIIMHQGSYNHSGDPFDCNGINCGFYNSTIRTFAIIPYTY